MPPTAAVHPDGADADSPARMKLEISIYTMVAKMNPPKMPTEGNAPRPSGKSGKSSAFLLSLRQACSSLMCCFRPSAKKSITSISCPLTRTTPRRLLLQSRKAAVHPQLQRFFTRPEARIHPVSRFTLTLSVNPAVCRREHMSFPAT